VRHHHITCVEVTLNVVVLVVACMGCTSKNTYKVKNHEGQDLYRAEENTGMFARQVCASNRTLNLAFTDKHGKEVIRIKRPVACTCCLIPCLLQVEFLKHLYIFYLLIVVNFVRVWKYFHLLRNSLALFNKSGHLSHALW